MENSSNQTSRYGNLSALQEQGQIFMKHLLRKDPVYSSLKSKELQLRKKSRGTEPSIELLSVRENIRTMETVLHASTLLSNGKVQISSDKRYKEDEILKRLNGLNHYCSVQLKHYSYYFQIQRLQRCREQLLLLGHDKNHVINDNGMVCDSVEIIQNNNVKTLLDEYENSCRVIANLIGDDKENIKNMNLGELRQKLQNSCREKYELFSKRVEKLKRFIGARKLELDKGSNGDIVEFNNSNLTSMLFDLCFRDGDMNNTRNIENFQSALVYTNIGFVKNLAYKVCSNIGVIHRYSEAVSCGFYGLALAVQKYIQLIKEGNRPDIVFTMFATKYVLGYVKSGMTDIGTGGVISTSTYNKIYRDRKNKMKDFNRCHRNVGNEDREILYNAIASDDNDSLMDNFMVSNESACAAEQSDTDNETVWDNLCKSSEFVPDKLAQARHYHDLYMNTIKEMFTTRDNNGTPIFNRYDIRLFEMVYGFCFKLDNGAAKFKNEFIQSEIAAELSRMYREEGIVKTFTQPAIVARTNKLEKKIIDCIKNNPSLFKKLSVINKAYNEMPEYMEYLSNDRENNRTSFLSGELPVIDTTKFDEQTFNTLQECKEKNIEEVLKLKERVLNFDDLFSPSIDYMSSIEDDVTEIFNESAL